MSELLPIVQARATRDALVEYVTTAIEFTDQYAQDAFAEFLTDPADGIFQGPYVRTRLPFEVVTEEPPLSVLPEWFQPYAHQAEAFRRLSASPQLPGERDRAGLRIPEPTIVTTGTGSGKTESFLYPVLDYAVRARARGVPGIKAVILYPMNALANDQAGRLARMIHESPELSGVTAALYTGEHSGAPRTAMTADGLIEDRNTIRSAVPDIILTNYKMLDQLLLRSADRPLWEHSAESLRYLVLDEFHTYNGAQGTDVALLIRRLRLLLDRLSAGRGTMVPVATSATLGDDRDIAPVADFAATVFGVPFPAGSVVTERRSSHVNLQDEARRRVAHLGLVPDDRPSAAMLEPVLDLLPQHTGGLIPDPDLLTDRLLRILWQGPAGSPAPATAHSAAPAESAASEMTADSIRDLYLAHPLVAALLDGTQAATALSELAARVVPYLSADTGVEFLEALCGALAHVRSSAARNSFPNLEVHLWTREVSRVDRAVSPAAAFAWSEDRTVHDGNFLPAIYCRSCGRSGWGIALTDSGDQIVKPQRIREEHVRRSGRFRALISSPDVTPHQARDDDKLRYLDPERRCFSTEPPADDAGDLETLPVLMHTGGDAVSASQEDRCPSCDEPRSIRFVGSRTATLLSVALSSLFGTAGLDPAEKKSLVFTDSVQDAAHRAGFVEARSHSLAVRSVIESSLTDTPLPLAQIAQRMIQDAVTPEQRFRLLHPAIAENSAVRGFWDDEVPARERRRARDLVIKRVNFDLQLEAGLVGSYGRTLASTGTAAASVAVDSREATAVGRRVLDRADVQQMISGLRAQLTAQDTAWQRRATTDDGARAPHRETTAPDPARGPRAASSTDAEADTVSDHAVDVWVRGVLERMRTDGAMSHEWLRSYRRKGGKRHEIWGGRRPRSAMPAFPTQRRAPQFPATGALPANSLFSDAARSGSWYVDWTTRCLGLTKRTAGHLIRPLFDALTDAGITDAELSGRHGGTHAVSYGLLPERVVMARLPQDPPVVLRCGACGAVLTGLPAVLTVFTGAPCPTHQCHGRLSPHQLRPSFYRTMYRGDMRRVIAREHTSLLTAETRLGYENAFKNSANTPGAPNVLVATPTLEMGIDIGDLSTVILASIPDTVASYLQRVGRAGRLTGNSLDLAFMSTRGQGSAIMEPRLMLNGSVRPPAAYLSAQEILHRQFTAFLCDRMAGDETMPEPARSASVMRSAQPGTFLGELLADVRAHASARVDEFLSAFTLHADPRTGMTADAAAELRSWVTPTPEGASGLEDTVHRAVRQWLREKDQLRFRRQKIEQKLARIESGEEIITSEEDQHRVQQLKGQQELLDEQERTLGIEEDPEARARLEKRLQGSRGRLRAEESQLSHEHWISVLERFGLLPNFTLFDDSVSLDVTLSFEDEDGNWQHIPAEYQRAGFTALTELAPGNHFYAGGHDLQIDTVDLGTDSNAVRTLAFCPDCGHSMDISTEQRPTACPVCLRPGIADAGQHLRVVELTKVYSSMLLNRAMIGDSEEDRTSYLYETQTVPDFSAADTRSRWSVDGTGVGVTMRRGTRLTRLNVGQPREGARMATLAGRQQKISGFRVCGECGHLDQETQRNAAHEHQPWCSQARAEDPESITVVLARELTTESVMISLPPSVAEDSSTTPLWSFYAAIMLGLRERFGGEISHVSMEVVPDVTRNNADSLLLYDSVPGGTGYLSELATPESLWQLFREAHRYLAACPCQHEEKAACFRCLLPHVRANHRDSVSRTTALEILAGVMGTEQPGETMSWRVSEGAAPISEDFDSALEKRFLRIFRAAVAALDGASVVETSGDGGTGFSALIHGVKYAFTPQVQLGHVQPDAVLSWPGNHGVRGVAIFLDGKRFHASAAHNRVGDDAEKRTALREQGYLVWAITDQDLDAFEALQRGETAADQQHVSPLEGLVLPSTLHVMRHQGMTEADLAYITLNPVAQLIHLIATKPRDQFARARAISQVLNVLLFPQSPTPIPRDSLGMYALEVLNGAPQDTPPTPRGPVEGGVLRREGPLVIVANLRSAPNAVAVVLDDREAAVESPDFDHAWRVWLALSNLRQPLASAAESSLETWSSLSARAAESEPQAAPEWLSLLMGAEPPAQGAGPEPTRHAASSTGAALPADRSLALENVELSEEWRQRVDEALSDGEKELLTFAGLRGMPVPEIGEEFEGIPVDLAWPEQKIAWLVTAELADQFARVAQGWIVLGPDLAHATHELDQRLPHDPQQN